MRRMTPEYSIWLRASEAQEALLAGTMVRLSAQLGGIAFAPHVTIQGDIGAPLEDLKSTLQTVAATVAVQNWRVQAVEHTAHFFRYLYLRFADEPVFGALQTAVQRFTQTAHGLSPFPHLSLAYGQAQPDTEPARATLASEFTAQVLVFDRLAIARSARDVPISEWSCIAQYPLTGSDT